jgi:hypothetical protein
VVIDEPDQFTAGITGSAEDRSAHCHSGTVYVYTYAESEVGSRKYTRRKTEDGS